jgi:hypothetical protein
LQHDSKKISKNAKKMGNIQKIVGKGVACVCGLILSLWYHEDGEMTYCERGVISRAEWC